MSIRDPSVIDFVGSDLLRGRLVLTVADDLAWDDPASHLAALEKKLGTYVSFLESGQVYELHPGGRAQGICIEVVFEKAPPEDGRRFLIAAEAALRERGLELSYRTFREGN